MTTDTSEKGLEDLIAAAMAGSGHAAPGSSAVAQPTALYGGTGWILGDWHDYDRDFAVDLVQLSAYIEATQPRVVEALDLGHDGPTRQQFLARLQGEITKRGVIDVLRHG
ncbi:type I restriction endonuclease subunit R, partial [bacterium]|nr:type I restriction endonuclease subunit R [bacterium]